MTTTQRTTTAVVILAIIAVVLALTSAAWPFWAVYGVIAAGTVIELIRARHA
ncbi:hypothetical protein GS534_00935 [Rhodococcus hoagii]|nr:hypothetical protein [Prescottella equi]